MYLVVLTERTKSDRLRKIGSTSTAGGLEKIWALMFNGRGLALRQINAKTNRSKKTKKWVRGPVTNAAHWPLWEYYLRGRKCQLVKKMENGDYSIRPDKSNAKVGAAKAKVGGDAFYGFWTAMQGVVAYETLLWYDLGRPVITGDYGSLPITWEGVLGKYR